VPFSFSSILLFFYYIFNLLTTFKKIPAIRLLISTFQHFFFFQLPPISFLFLSLFSKHFVFARFTPHPTSLVPNYRNIKTRKTEPSFMIPRPPHPAQDESSPAYQFSPFLPHFSSLIEAIFCTAFHELCFNKSFPLTRSDCFCY
jgi:hypothetical protein